MYLQSSEPNSLEIWYKGVSSVDEFSSCCWVSPSVENQNSLCMRDTVASKEKAALSNGKPLLLLNRAEELTPAFVAVSGCRFSSGL